MKRKFGRRFIWKVKYHLNIRFTKVHCLNLERQPHIQHVHVFWLISIFEDRIEVEEKQDWKLSSLHAPAKIL